MHGAEWIGTDLDKTLAKYESGNFHTIGAPIMPMIIRVRNHLKAGIEVRIVTARVDDCIKFDSAHENWTSDRQQREMIEAWCWRHIGHILPITNRKDPFMLFCYDDRAVAVEANTGKLLSPEYNLAS